VHDLGEEEEGKEAEEDAEFYDFSFVYYE